MEPSCGWVHSRTMTKGCRRHQNSATASAFRDYDQTSNSRAEPRQPPISRWTRPSWHGGSAMLCWLWWLQWLPKAIKLPHWGGAGGPGAAFNPHCGCIWCPSLHHLLPVCRYSVCGKISSTHQSLEPKSYISNSLLNEGLFF